MSGFDPEREQGPDGVSGMIRDFTRRHGFITPPPLDDGSPEPITSGFYGEYGLVEGIDCSAQPEEDVVLDGSLLVVPPADALEDWVPANCPRRPGFSSTLELGCLSCSHSVIEYVDGFIEA